MPTSSIQSYFSSSPSKSTSSKSTSSKSTSSKSTSSKSTPGDGFTPEELISSLPTTTEWVPALDYEESDIASLEPGPRHLTLVGRVVNIYDTPKPSKRPKAAQGFLKLLIADDTGCMTVRLWYANLVYKVKLGQLVTIWTMHISQGDGQVGLAPTAAPLFTSIYPEGERNCHLIVHERSDVGKMCKRPFGAKDSKVLPGLMTLKNFTDGGFDVDECKLLVCVKSIGPRKKFTNKNGSISEKISIVIFDDTAEGRLNLYGITSESVSAWQPSHTVLLIISPGWYINNVANLSLNGNTQLHVDPDMADTRYVRAFAQRLTKREHVNPPFPSNLFDAEEANNAAVKVLYKLSEIDEFARSNPQEKAVGYISVLITQLYIVPNYKRNMLLSSECCGVPLFSNSVKVKCLQCEKENTLRINPRILGSIIDETGQISAGKLMFSDAAWEQLLGRTAHQLVSAPLEVMKYLEQRLLFLRLTLGFGVYMGNEEIGRLAIWCVKM